MSDDVEFYLKNHTLFLHDFFDAGNDGFNLSIRPHDVQSGVWYEATWQTKHKDKRYASAQRHNLVWERVIKQFLQDERYEENRKGHCADCKHWSRVEAPGHGKCDVFNHITKGYEYCERFYCRLQPVEVKQ